MWEKCKGVADASWDEEQTDRVSPDVSLNGFSEGIGGVGLRYPLFHILLCNDSRVWITEQEALSCAPN